jgi:hypothetical protein
MTPRLNNCTHISVLYDCVSLISCPYWKHKEGDGEMLKGIGKGQAPLVCLFFSSL